MQTEPAPSFAALLRQYRLAAELTQEQLAEAARISARAVGDLERGRGRLPRLATVGLLAEALGLGAAERAAFLAAARGLDGPGAETASPAASPPAASGPALPAAAATLPSWLTPLIGREREEAAVAHLLGRPGVRLLTLTGPGGVGKTRLVAQVARNLSASFADGAVFVALAAVTDPARVLPAIAQALGLKEEGAQPIAATLAAALQQRQVLLVLDNCEQVASAGPLVVELLAACAGVKALVTSRAALHVRGEQEFLVPPLALPEAGPASVELLTHYAAVQLFVQRAQAVKPDFVLSEAMALVVAAICRRLDGLPLALELAAARSKLLPPQALLSRLEQSLQVLVGGGADRPERQHTLRATIAWSYALLGPSDQALFRPLAVFVGGATLDAVEAICGAPGDVGFDVLSGVATLVDHSLVQAESDSDGEESRVRLLETIREYAQERLTESGEGEALRRRHAEYYLALAEAAEPELTGRAQERWLACLEREHDNLRAALRWACEREAGEQGLRLAGALGRFWYTRGYVSEGRSWLEAALTAAGPGPSASRAKALYGAGMLALQQGDYGRGLALFEESLALSRVLADERDIAAALHGLGLVAQDQGDFARARALGDEALVLRRRLGERSDIAASLNSLGNVAERQGDFVCALVRHEEGLVLRRALGDSQGIADSLHNLGDVVYRQGDYARALALHKESLALYRAIGDRQGLANALVSLGNVEYQRGDFERSRALLEESLALYRALGDAYGSAVALDNLGEVASMQGDHEKAQTLYGESLRLSRDIGAKELVATGVEFLAWVAAARGQALRSGRLGGAAAALREALDMPLYPEHRGSHDRAMQVARAALGAEGFASAWAAGRALSLEQASAEALHEPGANSASVPLSSAPVRS
jgi:predicted ATPase/transcriptional regulator with XRE-family HTH domain